MRRRLGPAKHVIGRHRISIAILASGIFSIATAHAHVGPFYADFGQYTPKGECELIVTTVQGVSELSSDADAKCEFLAPGESYRFYKKVGAITFQFKPIDGSAYEMVYDIPDIVAKELSSPGVGNPIASALAKIGISNLPSPAVSVAIDRADAAKRAQAAKDALTEASNQDSPYVRQLRSKFQRYIVFESRSASDAVMAFNMDCGTDDRRYVPLINILLVGVSQLNDAKGWAVDTVEELGGEIRIFQNIQTPAGPITQPTLMFEVNKWGELRAYDMPTQSLLNACYGFFGPIWVKPPN